MKLTLKAILFIAAALLFSGAAYAICCLCPKGDHCLAGSPCEQASNHCCAIGECGIFCCQCPEGCRKPSAALALFRSIDLDDNDAVSLYELRVWADKEGRLVAQDEAASKKAFREVDSNSNGKIEPHEFDPDLGKIYEKMKKK